MSSITPLHVYALLLQQPQMQQQSHFSAAAATPASNPAVVVIFAAAKFQAVYVSRALSRRLTLSFNPPSRLRASQFC